MADGFEEIEALATVDILRRGGISTRMVSNTESLLVTGAHHIGVQADMSFSAFAAAGAGVEDVLVFPGGLPGAQHLADNGVLMDIMRHHDAEGGLVAAICAAPGLVATQIKGIEGKKATCFDGFEENLAASGMEYVKAPAVTDGQLITGRGAAFAIDFGLAILEKMGGKEAAVKVKAALLI